MADIFQQHGAEYRQAHSLPLRQLRAMRAIEVCRTAALGGHAEECDHCPYTRHAYNSCRNRHCPKCQNSERARWLEDRKAEFLPVEYFHVVFTLPEEAARIAYYNQREVYGILFRTATETLLTIASDPKHLGAEIGFFAILHTWGQNLLHHPPSTASFPAVDSVRTMTLDSVPPRLLLTRSALIVQGSGVSGTGKRVTTSTDPTVPLLRATLRTFPSFAATGISSSPTQRRGEVERAADEYLLLEWQQFQQPRDSPRGPAGAAWSHLWLRDLNRPWAELARADERNAVEHRLLSGCGPEFQRIRVLPNLATPHLRPGTRRIL